VILGRGQVRPPDGGEVPGEQALHQEGQPVGVDGAVGVRERDDVSGRGEDPLVPRDGEPPVLVRDEPELRVAFGDLAGRVLRAVVDHDDLEVRVAQPAQRLEALLHRALRVVRADHDRYAGGGIGKDGQLGAERALHGPIGRLGLAVPGHESEGPVLDLEASGVPLVREREHDRSGAAELAGGVGGGGHDLRLRRLALAHGVDSELREHERSRTRQVLEPSDVPTQVRLAVEVDVERDEVREALVEVLRHREVRVRDERVGIDGPRLVGELSEEPLDAPGLVPAHDLRRDLVAHEQGQQIAGILQRRRRLAHGAPDAGPLHPRVQEADVLGPRHPDHQAKLERRGQVAEPWRRHVVQPQRVGAELRKQREVELDDRLLGERLAGVTDPERPVRHSPNEELPACLDEKRARRADPLHCPLRCDRVVK
jgi:hypothetical protein